MPKPRARVRVTTIRLPSELHAELKETAERSGRSMNEEIIARLAIAPNEITLRDIARQNGQIMLMVQRLVDSL
jgi:predicted transcriptional regulator